jgi:uncharacterized membrane protein YraQ (UPF0718 family)
MITEILYLTAIRFLKSVPILALACLAVAVLSPYTSEDRVGRLLIREKKRNILVASSIGLVSPGPLAPYMPLLRLLNESGLPLSVVAAFITSQTLVGPLRAFLEIEMFGLAFFVFRVITSFFIAISVGVCFQLLEKQIAQ